MSVRFIVKNGGTRSGDIFATNFALTDESSAEYRPVLLRRAGFMSNSRQHVIPGTQRALTLVYEVPAGGGPFVWRFWSGGQDSGTRPAVLALQ